MVQRVLALLLIGAWQLQAAVPPHWHAGMSAAELVAHGEHRHFHSSHESHSQHDHADHHAHHAPDHSHAHHHESGPIEHDSNDGALGCQHDDDAVYIDAGSVADVTSGVANLSPPDVATFETAPSGARPSLQQHASASPRYGGELSAMLHSTRLLL